MHFHHKAKKGFDTIVILIAWNLWNHIEMCEPSIIKKNNKLSVLAFVDYIMDELSMWKSVGVVGSDRLACVR